MVISFNFIQFINCLKLLIYNSIINLVDFKKIIERFQQIKTFQRILKHIKKSVNILEKVDIGFEKDLQQGHVKSREYSLIRLVDKYRY